MSYYRDDLASIHDAGFGHIATGAATELLKQLDQRGIHQGLVVDLGCGSGILSERASNAGYDVLGIDLSEPMLALAQRRAPRATFRHGSLLTAQVPSCVAVCAVGEVLNYPFDPGNTAAARRRLWRRVHQALVPGGLFLFDVAGRGRLGAKKVERAIEGNDWAVLVWAEENGGLLTRRITSFRRTGELYARDEEVHRLKLVEPGEVRTELRVTGFRVRRLKAYGEWTLGKGHAAFLAEKR